MRKMLPLVIGLTITGCEAPFMEGYKPLHHYTVACFGPVDSEVPLDEAALASNAELARNILDELGILPKTDFCNTFINVPVHVRAGWYVWITPEGKRLAGVYDMRSGIILSQDMKVFTHEMLHHVDAMQRVVCSYEHCFWEERRYNEASHAYAAKAINPASPSP